MTQRPPKEFNHKKAKAKRKTLFLYFALFLLISGGAYGLYYYFIGSRYISTDNAYVGAEMAEVTPFVGGIVKEIRYKNTDFVKAGDVLVILDDTDTRLALAQAEADLAKAQFEKDRAEVEYKRRETLSDSGSVSQEEITNSKNAYKAALALVNVAKVAVEKARVDLDRTIIRSPVDGIVAKRQVQLGQRVDTKNPLMSIVPLDQVHVDANFKEVQMRNIHVGQKATLTSDLYGEHIVFHGEVVGIAGGTGSAFAVIPAQNATGNWIKVVQRLPVRIKLNPEELKKHPLRVGLSMEVDIDISQTKQD